MNVNSYEIELKRIMVKLEDIDKRLRAVERKVFSFPPNNSNFGNNQNKDVKMTHYDPQKFNSMDIS